MIAKVNLKKEVHNNFVFQLGRCKTNLAMDAILSEPTEHSHAPTIDQPPVVELKNKIKLKAADSEEATSNILFTNYMFFSFRCCWPITTN